MDEEETLSDELQWGNQDKQENALSNYRVPFQTGQVHSEWLQSFVRGMQLLLITYTLRFNDETSDKRYTIVSWYREPDL